jgi:hypothetical protein
MTGRYGRVVAGLLSAIALVAACSHQPDAHERFVADVQAVCAHAVAHHAGHPFPVSGFDPEHPNPDQLPEVGDYYARYGGLPEVLRSFTKLKPPPADATQWHALEHLAILVGKNAQRQIATAHDRDAAGFVRAVHAHALLVPQLNRDGNRFGFTSGSACTTVFG